ncbi:Maf family protein [Geminicoccus roseus]|uniref:Maf family protein n=1 Tax=Geminicoccus roseus TaxID=404900 RepID=UPI000411AB47|nr:Maf family nucleotide pyrophosphatase [Geminicoccus roseus]
MAEPPLLILASQSPARRRMLEAAGLSLVAEAASVDESEMKHALAAEGVSAQDAAVILAEVKAQRVAARYGGDALVLGADQMLEVEGRWLDKPETLDGAREQLRQLRGRQHRLWSAAVLFRSGARICHHVAHADLWMRPFTDEFLEDYLARADDGVWQSVGAYHLEGAGAQLFTKTSGDYFTILGLPLLQVLQALRDQGVLRR